MRTKVKDFVEYYENNTANFKHFRLQEEDISEIFDVIGELKDYDYEFIKNSSSTDEKSIIVYSRFPIQDSYPSQYTGHLLEFRMKIPESPDVKETINDIYTRLLTMDYRCHFFKTYNFFHLQVATPESYPDLKSSKRKPFSR